VTPADALEKLTESAKINRSQRKKALRAFLDTHKHLKSGDAKVALVAWRQQAGSPNDPFANNTVKNYVHMLETLRDHATGRAKDWDFNANRSKTADQIDRALWARMRNAAIVEVPCALYAALYHMVDRMTTEQVGCTWSGPEDPPPDDTPPDFIERIDELGKSIRLPEKRPFATVFFAYDVPPAVSKAAQRIYFQHLLRQNIDISRLRAVRLMGHLVSEGIAAALLMVTRGDTDWALVRFVEQANDEWMVPSTLAPWILRNLVLWVNDHMQVLQSQRSFGYRNKFRRAAKKAKLKGHVPPPYYTVPMRDGVIEEKIRSATERGTCDIDWQHRWLVRGHWMCRVRRGELPLDPKKEALLKQRKYKVFTLEQPDAKTWEHLAKRGVKPKGRNEWMAVLLSWRKDYKKGPEDKPLIPSVRKSAKSKKGKKR